ncbi:ABC transporter permease [Georgenia muralis]|uniref:Putative spermidine/putrescine transport system permease protein n=1 Tax=Georgenia muralis TaxID=154117 RepID=A0A3N4ZK71_9MICO|nr:ABC transporter permease [Georgenia muralis]RPF26218.1 putative spermidine/putrescine transport system permease protein [Georgenia muralis]
MATTEAPESTSNATEPVPSRGVRRIVATPSTWLVWFLAAAFFVFLIGILISVIVDSFARGWFSTWLPPEWTTEWYSAAWRRFDLTHVLGVTLGVALTVVVISILIGLPAAYLLARRDFPGKRLVSLLFLLPIIIPPVTYGIPLATVMYNLGLGRTLTAVVLVNLVPSVPFVILTMTPFIEQINPSIENAARMCGASLRNVFLRILAPLLVPGILAAGILVLVRTVGMFELTFLVSGPRTDTLVVAIYRAMTQAGGAEARQLISAMAFIYTATMLTLLIIALRYINPTQLVARVRDTRDD